MIRTKALEKITNLFELAKSANGHEAENARRLAKKIQAKWGITDVEVWWCRKSQVGKLAVRSKQSEWMKMGIANLVALKHGVIVLRKETAIIYWTPGTFAVRILLDHIALSEYCERMMKEAWRRHNKKARKQKVAPSMTTTSSTTTSIMGMGFGSGQKRDEEKYKRSVGVGIIQGMIETIENRNKRSKTGLPVWKSWPGRDEIEEVIREKYPHLFEGGGEEEQEQQEIEVYEDVFNEYRERAKSG